MEFLEGKDLAEVIEEARSRGRCLPAWFAIHIAIEVLQATAAMRWPRCWMVLCIAPQAM